MPEETGVIWWHLGTTWPLTLEECEACSWSCHNDYICYSFDVAILETWISIIGVKINLIQLHENSLPSGSLGLQIPTSVFNACADAGTFLMRYQRDSCA